MMDKRPVRVVETQDVSDQSLEKIINEMVAEGWLLDNIRFAMRDASRRPSMAFLIFFHPEYAKKVYPEKG